MPSDPSSLVAALPASIRQDFPLLREAADQTPPLRYLDNPATSQKPDSVLRAMDVFNRSANANVHRALHTLGQGATAQYEAARQTVADWIGAKRDDIIFTKNTTESLNLAAVGWGMEHIRQGDILCVTEMEHHSNLLPWRRLADRTGADLRWAPVEPDGRLDDAVFDQALADGLKLLAITQVSNVLGAVTPVDDWCRRARAAGAVTVVDAAQSVPHMPVDVNAMACDFLAFSGHKMCGPTGIGVLYGRRERLEEMEPMLVGGEMVGKVTADGATWADIPDRFEAGTPPYAEAVGLAEAIRYLDSVGLPRIQAHGSRLAQHLKTRLEALPGVTVYGPETPQSGILSFAVDGVHPHDVAQGLNSEGIAARAGYLCAQPLMRKLEEPGLTRVGFYLYNTLEDAEVCAEAVRHVQEFFHG